MSKTFLPSQVPDLHFQVVMVHFFHVAADSRLGHNQFVQSQFVQDCGLAGVVEANDDDFEFPLALVPS